jgi:hypothetical protein
MVDTVDHEKTTHVREVTKATDTMMILANSEGTKRTRTAFGLSCGGSLESFFPSSPRVSRYRCTFQQGSIIASYLLISLLSTCSILSPEKKLYQSTSMVMVPFRQPNFDWIIFGLWQIFSSTTCLVALNKASTTLDLILVVRPEARILPSGHLTPGHLAVLSQKGR